MKKSFYLMAAFLVAMVGCNKEPQAGPSSDVDGKTYMQFSVNMLTTRTATDSDDDDQYGSSDATPDTEVGKDFENTISKVDIVLTNEGGAYVVADNITKIAAASEDTYVASFDTKALVGGTTYNVYIYANCDAPAEKNLDATSTATIEEMTAEDNFWMTNAYAPNSNGDITLPTDLSPYTQPQTPFTLGSYFVERAMARFDYMPINNNKYNIGAATVTLTEAALINQSKAFYLLRRVSETGTNENWTVGGVETLQNYVVDTDYVAKTDGYQNADAQNFDYHMSATTWEWKSINDFTEDDKDNWDGSDGGLTDSDPSHPLNEYYVWQYCKENTIPQGTDNDAQQKGLTTGIVFKGQITGTAVDGATGMIYVFNNVLYGTWDKVLAAAATADAPVALQAAVKTITDKTAPTVKDYADAGFTGYNPAEDGKYYAYYYYWNRHNDNGNNISMGPMEFAVVRNNVYKLCVDKISKFGHPDPTDPTNPDPDPENPTDPDESVNYYFNVTVKVLPWVVRVNHIEF